MIYTHVLKLAAGGIDLPPPVKGLMRLAANVMRAIAYKI